jgi:hypothetical protein
MMGGATQSDVGDLSGGKRRQKHMMMGGATEPQLAGGEVPASAEVELSGGKRHHKYMMGGATEPEVAGADLSGGKKKRKSSSPRRSKRNSRSPRRSKSPNRWIKYVKSCQKSGEAWGDALHRCKSSYK